MTAPLPLDLRDKFTLHHGSITHDVYRVGEGPAVVLMHELPGMTTGCLRAAKRIVDSGFRVYLPLFFLHPGTRDDALSVIEAALSPTLCIRHEFNLFAANGHSRITGWLRKLCTVADAECGNRGVGLIGMCLTGNIVLSVMLDPSVRAPVMCEPAIPLLHKSALGVPRKDIDNAVTRAAYSPILAFRFTTDTKCPPERFATLRCTFGRNIATTEIPTGPSHPFNIPDGSHSVLSGDYPCQDDPNHPVQHAFDQILLRFKTSLTARTYPTQPYKPDANCSVD